MKRIWCYIPKNFNLKFLGIIVCSFIALTALSQEVKEKIDYKLLFGEKYQKALDFFTQEKWITERLISFGIEPDFAKAIAFPEIVRYSAIQNSMEMEGLFTLYVQYGAKYANFSVGRFQMKPTFASQIEQDVARIPKLHDLNLNKIELGNTSMSRLLRVKRLNSDEWQLQYLIWFIKIMDQKYKNQRWPSDLDKLRFYATAYNCGYTQSEKEIRQQMKRRYFHTSIFKSTTCYNYSNISAAYYQSKY
jgi:hypothetical protein